MSAATQAPALHHAAGDGQHVLHSAPGLRPQNVAPTAPLKAAGPGAVIEARVATTLRDLAEENRTRLSQAIEVQGRILEMVARAARQATPGPVRYGARGNVRSGIGAMALALRA